MATADVADKPASGRAIVEQQLLHEGTQVVCAEQLVVGRRYDEVGLSLGLVEVKQFEVVRRPYRRESGVWAVDIRYTRDVRGLDASHVTFLALRDVAILPYPKGHPECPDGGWNGLNFIRLAEEFGDRVMEDPGQDCPCAPYHQ